MYWVRLIFAESSGTSAGRREAQVADLDHAKNRARHELDLERYLAAQRDPPGPVPVAVQVGEHGHVIWQLTLAERARELGR